MKEYAEQIRGQLRALSDPARQKSTQRFFKEPVKVYGAKSADVGKVARQALKVLKGRPKEDILMLCEELWQSGLLEEGGVACELAYSLREHYVPQDFAVFDRWLELYVANWAACDTLCNHSVGAFLQKYPGQIRKLEQWTGSANRWKQRAAAVSLILPARKGLFLPDIFAIADRLRASTDDLVQKGYGWMLKAASEAHPDAVFAFLMERKATMPRTAFRYALEKMPKEMRARAMEK